MEDWKSKLSGLNKELQAGESAEKAQKAAAVAAALSAFRKRLQELEPALRTAAEFGDAFGVDCQWEVGRTGERYPFLEFNIRAPRLAYRVECRDGRLYERLQEQQGLGCETEVTLGALAPRSVSERVTGWVQAAANANRKVPGKRR